MKMKKYLACLMAAMMMCGAFTACGGDKETDSTEDSAPDSAAANDNSDAATEAETEAATAQEVVEVTQAATEAVDVEDAVDAQSGQAYLAIVDSQWWIQYWGSSTDNGYMLSYNAGVADITGDGSYTVSVTADTNGFRLDTTQDANDQYIPSGLAFAAVIIKDGETACPDAIITIDSILIDGEEVEMTAKGYTNTEEGAIRSNIYNEWVSSPTNDARCADGFLYKDCDTSSPNLDNVDDYSAQIVDPASFNSGWTTVEVNFTISGMGEGSAAGADGEDASADDDEASADSTAE